MLWTSRTGTDYEYALTYLKQHGLLDLFDAFNENTTSIDFPTSRKIYADVYVDDNNAGGFIGWDEVLNFVIQKQTA